jgi:hypothetical protein
MSYGQMRLIIMALRSYVSGIKKICRGRQIFVKEIGEEGGWSGMESV